MKKPKKDKDKPSTLTVHVAIDLDLLKSIDGMAETQDRTRLNMISVLLKKALAQEVTA